MLSVLVSCLAPHLPQSVDLQTDASARLIPVYAEHAEGFSVKPAALFSEQEKPQVPEFAITAQARMPDVPLKLHLKPGFVLDGEIHYRTIVEYKERGRRDAATLSSGTAADLEFLVELGDTVRGGRCLVSLEIPWRTADRRTGVSKMELEYRIVGQNPDKDTARRSIGSIEAQVIAYKESRFRQFNAKGEPLFGPPRGFGLMQLDTPPPTADQVWDWRLNMRGGLALFEEKERIARGAPARTRKTYPDATDFTAEELKLETYQRYNGGAYWKWNDFSKRWVKTTRSHYADDCLALERAIEAGNPPPEWE